MIYIDSWRFERFTIPKTIGQIINCLLKTMPKTNGIEFLNPNFKPDETNNILAGPGLPIIETRNKIKLIK